MRFYCQFVRQAYHRFHKRFELIEFLGRDIEGFRHGGHKLVLLVGDLGRGVNKLEQADEHDHFLRLLKLLVDLRTDFQHFYRINGGALGSAILFFGNRLVSFQILVKDLQVCFNLFLVQLLF